MKVRPTGVFFVGECDVQGDGCTAIGPAPITAVMADITGSQINVCHNCLIAMISDGQWEIVGARITHNIDIAAYNKSGERCLIVEVKVAPRGPHPPLAIRASNVRRNLLMHSVIPRVPYFMVVYYPEVAFLWRDAEAVDAAPDYVIDLAGELPELTLSDNGESDHERAESGTRDWLYRYLGQTRSNGEATNAELDWADESGLRAAVTGGSLSQRQALPLAS
jgi:hypothetical protein